MCVRRQRSPPSCIEAFHLSQHQQGHCMHECNFTSDKQPLDAQKGEAKVSTAGISKNVNVNFIFFFRGNCLEKVHFERYDMIRVVSFAFQWAGEFFFLYVCPSVKLGISLFCIFVPNKEFFIQKKTRVWRFIYFLVEL